MTGGSCCKEWPQLGFGLLTRAKHSLGVDHALELTRRAGGEQADIPRIPRLVADFGHLWACVPTVTDVAPFPYAYRKARERSSMENRERALRLEVRVHAPKPSPYGWEIWGSRCWTKTDLPSARCVPGLWPGRSDLPGNEADRATELWVRWSARPDRLLPLRPPQTNDSSTPLLIAGPAVTQTTDRYLIPDDSIGGYVVQGLDGRAEGLRPAHW
jgi:hypothetical protein